MPKVEREVTVQAPVEIVYRAWRNFENFPKFMSNIEDVRMTASGRSHWKAKGPLGVPAEWDAEVTLDEPQHAIGWRSIEGNSSVKTAGRVNFEDRGGATRIRVVLDYDAPAGAAGNVIAKIFSDPEKQMEEDLRNFKETIERGWELSGFTYGESGDEMRNGETLGGSMGATSTTDLEAIDQANDAEVAPQDVDDPARRTA